MGMTIEINVVNWWSLRTSQQTEFGGETHAPAKSIRLTVINHKESSLDEHYKK